MILRSPVVCRPPLRLHRAAVAARILIGAFVVIGWASSGCAVVPAYQREYLSDPTMQPNVDELEDRGRDKLHSSREGAAGGNEHVAGGGCGCGN